MLAAAVWLVPRARADGLTGADAAVAIAVAVAAVALVGWDRRAIRRYRNRRLVVLGTGWLLALVALSRPAWVWISGALLVFAAHAVFTIRLLGVTSLGLARLALAAYLLVGHPGHLRRAAADLARPCRDGRAPRRAGQPVRRGARGGRGGARGPARAAGLAGGGGAPGAARHRRRDAGPRRRRGKQRCAQYAATLRRALVDRVQNAGWLLAELEPALRAARARGMPAEVQVVGEPGRPGWEVATRPWPRSTAC